MRSCCKQVREFVDFGKHLHARISEFYDELNEKAELERVKMLLEYLSRHEHHLEQTLARYKKEVHGGILEAWLEYSPTLDVDAVMETSQLRKILRQTLSSRRPSPSTIPWSNCIGRSRKRPMTRTPAPCFRICCSSKNRKKSRSPARR